MRTVIGAEVIASGRMPRGGSVRRLVRVRGLRLIRRKTLATSRLFPASGDMRCGTAVLDEYRRLAAGLPPSITRSEG